MIAIIIAITACKKTRTCSCTVQSTGTYVYLYRNSQIKTIYTSTNSSETNQTYDKVTKSDMKNFMNCNSRKETPAAETYTIEIPVSGDTTTTIVDVTRTNVSDYDCKIK